MLVRYTIYLYWYRYTYICMTTCIFIVVIVCMITGDTVYFPGKVYMLCIIVYVQCNVLHATSFLGKLSNVYRLQQPNVYREVLLRTGYILRIKLTYYVMSIRCIALSAHSGFLSLYCMCGIT
jgi:hypothetical protein